jgi:DNA invertase Pin-like site-specific DNA recombinase
MPIDGYIRVSRTAGREGERFISPAEQRKAIEGWAKLHSRELGEVFEDLDQSGKKRHRPGLDLAIDRVRSGQSEGVIVAKLDRFGRSVSHLGELLDILAAHDAALFTVAEGIDTSGRAGRMIASIMSAVAEFEVHRQGESWYVARANAVERGVYVGGTVPFGYVKDETGRLHPGPNSHLVGEMFAKRIGGVSWGHLADWLATQTGESWSIGSVRYMIANRAYLGEIHGGQGLVNLKGHQPLVDRASFEAAGKARGVAPGRSGRASGLLSGILRCASCRYALKPSMRVGGKLDYRCKTGRRENASRCSAPVSISAAVDELVVAEFFDRLGSYRAVNLDNAGDIEAAASLLAEAEAERDAVLDRSLRDLLDSDAYMKVIGDRQAEVDRARERLADTRAKAGSLPSIDLEQFWPDMSLTERRHVLAASLDCVFVRRGSGDIGERLHFCWLGSGIELPTRGRKWTPLPFEFPT